jgi:hypothetical protein
MGPVVVLAGLVGWAFLRPHPSEPPPWELDFEGNGSVAGSDGCGNSLTAHLDGDRLAYDGFHTLVACLGGGDPEAAETFWAVLDEGARVEIVGEVLQLRTDSGSGVDFEVDGP